MPGATVGFNVGKPVEFAEFRPFLVLFLIGWVLVIPWILAVADAYYTARIKNLELTLSHHQL